MYVEWNLLQLNQLRFITTMDNASMEELVLQEQKPYF